MIGRPYVIMTEDAGFVCPDETAARRKAFELFRDGEKVLTIGAVVHVQLAHETMISSYWAAKQLLVELETKEIPQWPDHHT